MKAKNVRRVYVYGGGGIALVFILIFVFIMGRASMKAEFNSDEMDLNKYDYNYKGVHYIIFYTPIGGMTTVNFTLDSLHKIWYEPKNINVTPNHY